VIVREGTTLGEGWHAGPGLDHAEIAAMRDALRQADRHKQAASSVLDGEALRAVFVGATIYVTLEPCCTQGRTPPCTTALIKAGFSRVVAAVVDPSPSVNGRGFRLLREAGMTVEVAEGPLAHRAKRQNDGQRKRVVHGLPCVHYKYAMSIDGRTSTDCGDSRWISGSESRALSHRWRSWSDAVVVGIGAVLADDPTLTAREVDCVRQPLRVVVDKGCSLPVTSKLARTASEGPVLVVCGEQVERGRISELESVGVTTVSVGCDEGGNLDPKQVCRMLVEMDVQTVLLEGGRRLAGAWWSAGLVDKVSAFVCARVLSGCEHGSALWGRGAADMNEASHLQEVEMLQIGPDVLISGYTGGPF
jgi:diaminohydroxyphosphoribosylaminopyrimidine deaminase/5-amino-6-(5-phosphoribosylamino)uracil reductase